MKLLESQENTDFSETTQDFISKIDSIAKKCKNQKSKPISKHTFLFEDKIKIDSWRTPDFCFKNPSKTVTNIRGLFSITNEKNIHRIVIRGYNKFFAVDEVKNTKWEALERNTKGPYALTLKENGCIIFISALSNSTLIVASKHSMGPIANGTSIHAKMGEIWLDKHLLSCSRTREQLAHKLYQMNATLVAELCDDAFEEHIIEYPPEKRGLYLHGININQPGFVTYAFDKVCSFALEWGFKQVDYVIFETLSELKKFFEESEKTKSYHGREIEGFVIRCKSRLSEEDLDFHDFFFKYKFKEPYFMYRRWRELTHSIISNTYKTNPRDSNITKEYVAWVRLLLKRQSDLALKYKQNHGIIALRKQFLDEYNSLSSDTSKMLRFDNCNDDDRNVLLVPIATIGCGKTTLALALSILFGFGHVQNDDIIGKKGKIKKFVQKLVEAFKHQRVVIADKNNHMYSERKDLIHLVSELSPGTRFIALYYHHFNKDANSVSRKQELDKILNVTRTRVFARGSNHQTIDATLNEGKTALGIMNGFLTRFEPLDASKKPDNLFEDIIILDPMKDSRVNLEIVVCNLHKIIPNYLTKMPTASEMDDAINCAINNYKSSKGHLISPLSCRMPEYFAIVLKDDLFFYVEDIMKTQKEETRAFWEHLKQLHRVQSTFHLTLIHIVDKSKYPDLWQYYLSQINDSGEICPADVEFTDLVWDSRLMALSAIIHDIKKKNIVSVNAFPHVTIGTENKTILAKESNDLLSRWKTQTHRSDIMSLKLQSRRFHGIASAVYPNVSSI